MVMQTVSLAKFDKDWIRYNRDLIRKVQKYEEEHGEGEMNHERK